MSVAEKVIAHPVLTVVSFALIAVMSLYTLSDVAIDLFPDIENPVLMVQASYSGAGPESVEKSVTALLESSLTSVGNLKKLTSTSSEGSSRVRLEFDYGTDLEAARNDIRDKLDRVKRSLPDAVEAPTIVKYDSSSQPIMRIAIRGNRSAEDLKAIAEDMIKDRLEQASGVAQATVSGGRAKIVRAEISQNRLDAYGLTLTGVATALAAQNLELGGGKVADGSKNYLVRTTGEFDSVAEIADTSVGSKNGYVIRLSDLGRVFSGFEDETSAVYINGQTGVYVSVQKQSGSNTVKTADAVYSKMKEIEAIIPADVSLEIVSDDTRQIRDTISALISSAWQGALLAMAILFLFLRSAKSTVIMGISIPFSIMVTLLAMFFAKITLNMMTMTGLILGVGMIVDSSIVILENIYQYRERGTKPTVAAMLGSQEMIMSVVSGNLTTVCVFIPFIFFKTRLGILGQIFQDMIFTIVIALLSSLLVALFLVPVLASHFFPLTTRTERPLRRPLLVKADAFIEGLLGALTGAYRRALRTVLAHRGMTSLCVLGAFLLSLSLIPRMNIAFMPSFGDSTVTLQASLPIGTRLEDTRELLKSLETIAEAELKGVKTIITSVGTGSRGSNSTYSGSIAIQLADAALRVDDSATIQKKLRAHFAEFPNAVFGFSQGRREQMSGGSDIDVAIRSDDLDAALSVAREIKETLAAKVPEVSEGTISLNEGLPEVEVVIDRDRAYSFGITVSAAAREINACIDGKVATVFRDNGKEYDVVLMLRGADRSKVPDLERIYVQGSAGRVAVANFASVRKGVGPVSIARENQTRIIHVTAGIVADMRADKVEAKIKKAIAESVVPREGVSIAYEGSWKNIVEQGNVFILIFTMALLLVFGVMAGTYESFRDPVINLFTIPLMLIGVVGIYLLTGQPLSMFTAVGAVMLTGIVVNNGIILVDYTNLLVARGMPVREACLEAGASRLRPVLMTTLTTILGMIPMAFFSPESSSMIKSIGVTVIGGLTSSTLITLFFIPVVYSKINQIRPIGLEKAETHVPS